MDPLSDVLSLLEPRSHFYAGLDAEDRLRGGSESVASIAFSLGYESEAAFYTAFKRMMFCSPTQYRRRPAMLTTNE